MKIRNLAITLLACCGLPSATSMDYRYFVAGGTCAAISHGITTPIDVIKTKIQANPQKFNKGMKEATLTILKEDGPDALLGGLGPTVVGYGIEGAMKFGVYEICKPLFAAIFGEHNKPMAYLMASVAAGAVAALLLCPMEYTRIRMVTDPEYADQGLITGFPKLVKEEGLRQTFSGLWAMLAKQVPYTFGKQVSFDVFAGILYAFLSGMEEAKLKWFVSVTAAFLASLVACIFSQPGDMILTETYRPQEKKGTTNSKKATKKSSSSSPSEDRAIRAVVQKIYQRGGLNAFFTGTQARIVHVGMIITSQLVIYDMVKQMLGLPATGSH
ncbi:hypothetical protein FisN_15Hh162 [Fistulifera solaris]|uniref:Solute carrier family 25 (Mitochondrial phosphate transporter), member 3 n=1 Tax=Fistulifera solaris TaxID=1519565 RepID=A0A1Z5JFI3_FISSO|nr:hypothetical protein FisN_15Hh162 [Fistulifera solaris]|eukprot:GAX12686.1 hypothetical protein FisN_15Hh162 [Fistulifera solaris]